LDLAANDSVRGLPLSGLMNQAYAARAGKAVRISGKNAAEKLIKTVKNVRSGNMSLGQASKSITQAMGEIIHASRGKVQLRGVLTDIRTLTTAASLIAHSGARYFRNLMRGKDANGNAVTSRTPIFLQIAAIAYLETKISDECSGSGCITDDDMIEEIRVLYSRALAQPLVFGYDNPRIAGHQFHLTMTALLHLWGDNGSPYGKLKAIEAEQNITLWKHKKENGFVDAFTKTDKGMIRKIDLVMDDGGDRPVFIEVKSYKGQEKSGTTWKDIKISDYFKQWNYTGKDSENSASGGNHRQYLLDKIVSQKNGLIENQGVRNLAWKAEKIHWLFQDYKQKTVKGLSANQIDEIQTLMAKNVEGKTEIIRASLGIAKGAKYPKSAAKKEAIKHIESFNVKTILKESGSDLVEQLFDAVGEDAESKKVLIAKVEELIFGQLP